MTRMTADYSQSIRAFSRFFFDFNCSKPIWPSQLGTPWLQTRENAQKRANQENRHYDKTNHPTHAKDYRI